MLSIETNLCKHGSSDWVISKMLNAFSKSKNVLDSNVLKNKIKSWLIMGMGEKQTTYLPECPYGPHRKKK